MTDTTDTYDARICDDCACWWANADLSHLDLLDDTQRDIRHAAVVAAAGVPDGWNVVIADGDDYDFSWRDCDACCTPLAGDRVRATFVDMRPKNRTN